MTLVVPDNLKIQQSGLKRNTEQGTSELRVRRRDLADLSVFYEFKCASRQYPLVSVTARKLGTVYIYTRSMCKTSL